MKRDPKYQPLVSVILPVWNGGSYLQKAVQSILWQTYQNFELLILDDGSTDHAVENLERANKDERIKIIKEEKRQGLAYRLNQGVTLASGVYIARMDADDIAFPQRLEKQVDYLRNHPSIDLLGTRALVFQSKDNILGCLPFASDHQTITRQPWRGFPLPHPTWMGRRSWFQKNCYRLPEIQRAEDQDLLLQSYLFSSFACLEDVLLGYRQGSFHLYRTLQARRALLSAQKETFLRRGQWKNLILAFTVGLLKIVIDLVSGLPGMERLFFSRMQGEVSDSIKKDLAYYIDALESDHD